MKIRNERRETEEKLMIIENEKEWMNVELKSKRMIVDMYKERVGKLERGKTEGKTKRRGIRIERTTLRREVLTLKRLLESFNKKKNIIKRPK